MLRIRAADGGLERFNALALADDILKCARARLFAERLAQRMRTHARQLAHLTAETLYTVAFRCLFPAV
ncbi:hypothetical protein SDC9_119860 [bioreactor metagenome]|uniref:Uncharacterized protein n=1 Tax=bioreactor metagenome TaxID=1076179 RepID=A0A645C9K2_9ZZZZ